MYVCDICDDKICKYCTWGNPCLGCVHYDRLKDTCTSHGACAEIPVRSSEQDITITEKEEN